FLLGVAADPTHAGFRDGLVDLYIRRDEWDSAASALQHAMAASPWDLALRWRLSEAQLKRGDFDAALAVLDISPAVRLDRAELARGRAVVLEAAGRNEEAASELEAAYRIDARHGAALLALLERTNLSMSSEQRVMSTAELLVKQGAGGRAVQVLD